MTTIEFIQQRTSLSEKAIQNTIQLLQEGSTIPFISRYRKERTGGLDEVQVGQIRDLQNAFQELIARQKFILETIKEQGKLNDLLKDKIETCFDSHKLEDLYLPYKKKKVTKGDKARKAGLESLAKLIMSQRGGDPYQMAEKYIKGEIYDEEEALQGARDIMAEWINENSVLRDRLRDFYRRKGIVLGSVVNGKEAEGQVYKDYFNFREPLFRIASHRFLAVSRAEKEGIIKLKIDVPSEEVWSIMERFFVKNNDASGAQILKACKESYSRLLSSSIETEVYNEAKEKADKAAVLVFTENLRQLLLASPVGAKRTLAIDPGFRTGCKVVVLDEKGDLLNNTTIFPHPPQNEKSAAQSKIAQLTEAYKVEVIAIGDGTAGRETESFIKTIRFKKEVEVYIVREDGASIYSASSIARKEFPQFDVTVRGAISIGRRLMDPLAELVKIEPKSLGVGSYQHEVNATLLKKSLDDVVISCVNAVGVDVNTASPYLLQYVSGLGPTLAENIVKHRSENGFFKSREELKTIPRMGDKAFEQSAGFLRVRNSEHPLDNSAVHPERYKLVSKMAQKLKLEMKELVANDKAIQQLKMEDFNEVDAFTFEDIIAELKKPGRDPRQLAKIFEFDPRLKTINDVIVGMQLPGIVTNVAAFGAFVNIGIKENGLIHKSQMGENYVEDPTTVVRLHQHVISIVTELDVPRKRIGLKLIQA